jgi:hypothetical protein
LNSRASTTTALFIGDSTGNWLGEWIELMLRGVASSRAELTTWWHLWQEQVSMYGINEIQQNGAGLVTVVDDTFTKTAPALAGGKPDIGQAVWVGDGWSLDGARAVWASGSGMTKINAAVGGDFDATWEFIVTPTSATTRQTFRFVARLTANENVRLYGEITASTTGNWTIRLFKKMAAGLTTLGTIPINGNDLSYVAGTEVTLQVRMTLTGDALRLAVNGAAATGALSGVLTAADIAELGTFYAVQGGVASAKLGRVSIKSRQPASALHWYNASIPGAGISYFTPARLATMVPTQDVDLIVFNLAHNAGAQDGSVYGPLYEAFIDLVAERFPNAGIMVSSQHPETNGTLASFPAAQFSRNVAIREMCARRGFDYIPAMEAFMSSASPYNYVKGDGMHPTDGDDNAADNGQKLWAAAGLAELKRLGLTRIP